MTFLNCSLFLLAVLLPCTFCGWRDDDKIKLKDVEVLTLYSGRMTNGRRSSPVPQLNCVGGTAGCNAFRPQVVQCYNRGWDGQDFQWECKTDMDNAFRFGQVTVTCEGYSYPEDSCILKGSCGLEYTIDLTKEGFAQQPKHHNYYGGGQQNGFYSNPTHTNGKSQSVAGGLLMLIIIGFFIYALYRTCLAPTMQQMGQRSPTNDDYRPNDYPGGSFFQPNAPPPPGFHPDYTSGDFSRTSCGSQPRSTGAGGFWTGAATGGILGYMFGRSGNSTGYRQQDHSSKTSWGGPSTSHTYHSPSSEGSSSGTRTASGFGGTRRR